MAKQQMRERSARDFFPKEVTLPTLREAAAGCRGCDLWRRGTQTVFGEGPRQAPLMLVGEQPGDEEDLAGRPFVGPSGRLLDQALGEAGIERADSYLTNVVKHFKWAGQRGRRRLHKKPSTAEVGACLPWLEAEIDLVGPDVLLFLGSTAAKAVLGSDFSVTRMRGEWLESSLAPHVMATVHPSAILRITDSAGRRAAFRRYVQDFESVSRALAAARAS
ncbi:MAG TPA: UdgX family uracil-DNA binding protein [Longimicrobiales bacterium]|nr:UdgX family uracil-DNA binding protein [Longimicrobiales bacterium]